MEKKTEAREIKTYHVKNMVCRCCVELVRERLEKNGFRVNDIELGKVSVEYDPGANHTEEVERILGQLGFEPILGREAIIVEQIKQVIIELVHHMNNVDSIVRKSDYLVEKLGMSYPYLSRLFSSHEPVTLERFIILQKMERIKELIDQGEFTLSEIAFMMDYSSVQYLSRQFHEITGYTVSDYKQGMGAAKKPIDRLY